MSQEKDKFIILKKVKYGEADLILHAISTSGEKLSFLARAALKSKKRFGGGILEPSHFVSFSYRRSSQAQLHTLQEATLINDFAALKRSYDHLEFALHALECVAKVSQEGDRDSSFLFNLLGNTLKAIEICEDLLVMKMHFYLKFLFQQGVINAEPWMAPFLKTNLSDVNQLKECRGIVDDELRNVEKMLQHYLEHASLL
ncbi:hypothetical protein BDW_11245 [Bdellovibrio bacteriovorus W]|nr:hypothetical protein BDW_11245 [Bdellovibrio bacteriovorus W]